MLRRRVYRGHTNLLTVVGQCRRCQRRATLRSFDATQGSESVHVDSLCSVCGQHGRLSLREFEKSLAERLALELKEAATGDRAAVLRLAEAFADEGRWESVDATLAEHGLENAELQSRVEGGRALARLEANKPTGSWRGLIVWFAFCAVGALALVGSVVILQRRVRILVDNPTRSPATLRLDGAPWVEVPAHGFVDVTVWRGTHRIDAVAGVRSESFECAWSPPAGEGRRATYVCDPFLAGAYTYYPFIYTAQTRPAATSELHFCERTFFLAVVDDAFVAPPAMVRVPSGQSVTRHCLAHIESYTAGDIGRALIARNRSSEAVRYLERELEENPEDERPLPFLAWAARVSKTSDAFQKWLESHCDWSPASLAFQRFRQDRLLLAGDLDGLEEAYADAPGTAIGLYLRGRAANNRSAALADFERALALDPKLSWALLDSGELMVAQGDLDNGLVRLRAFDEARPRRVRPEVPTLWRALALARRWQELSLELKRVSGGRDHDLALEGQGHWLIATGAADSEWASFRSKTAEHHARDLWVTELEIGRLRWEGKEVPPALLGDLETRGGDRVGTTVALEIASGRRGDAGEAIDDSWNKGEVSRRMLQLTILLGIAAEWAGEDGSGWFRLADKGALVRLDRDVARFLLGRISLDSLVAGDWRRTSEQRALSLVAQALRTAAPMTRAVLLDEAERFGSWELGDAAILARTVFALTPPRARR